MSPPPKISVAMLGARMHYALPRLLQKLGMLERFYTDSYIGNKPVLKAALNALPEFIAPKAVRNLLGREDSAIDPAQVISYDVLGYRYAFDRYRHHGQKALDDVYERTAQRFANSIVRYGLGACDAIWGFNTASVELFTQAKSEGRRCILEQTILPKTLELRLLAEVSKEWPKWQVSQSTAAAESPLEKREAKEWALADRIVVGSSFVQDGLVELGVDAEKIIVVPYGVEPAAFPPRKEKKLGKGPLNVLFVGEVGLRKGVPYLLEALRELGPQRVKAVFAGPIAVDPFKLNVYSEVADFLGAVPRSEMWRLYQQADVFVLPSILEGSATASYEALLTGLPMVVTANTGTIIQGGDAGYMVPPRDAAAIRDALGTYVDDRSLLEEHALGARTFRGYASEDRYQDDIKTLIEGLIRSQDQELGRAN